MVSRGVSASNILRGVHESMAFRFARLLQSIGAKGVTLITGGLAGDKGLQKALQEALDANGESALVVRGHELSIHAGAIGAAIWGAFRHRKLELGEAAWTASAPS